MKLKIYTYSDPYKINRESYWDEIKNCPHFCVSQTMVNGLEEIYDNLKSGQQLTTIRILINSLYSNWEDINTRVKQIMEVDNAITSLSINSENAENIKRSLEFNTTSLVSCIRLFSELNLNAFEMNTSNLNEDQKLLIDIFKKISEREYTSFKFSHITDAAKIESGIVKALEVKHSEIDVSKLNMDTVVIHGIHQFSPSMLCAIEDISAYKNVILLFNYQEQYKSIYQTWYNIYSLFDAKIISKNDNVFRPIPLLAPSYVSNVLADNIGKLANGDISNLKNSNDLNGKVEIIEFANVTEFAGYAASLFNKAYRQHKISGSSAPILSFMPEQMYSASGKVNDILRAYFPEQFGERHFLDYPIGHFFVSITDMWDPDNEIVKVDNISDIKECLSAGIISEKHHGQLLNTFNRIEPFIEKDSTLKDMIIHLKKLRKYVSPEKKLEKRIGYLNVSKDDLYELTNALSTLEEIVSYFFSDFNNGKDNFNRFYKKIHDFIVGRISNSDELDEEMRGVVQRLLDRMENTDLPETGTFNCIKQTMVFYLSQDESLSKGANWIVRDFEQIDGDVLRSVKQDAKKTCYHFCCLSDKDLCSAKTEKLPWPLDVKFFEYIYDPEDWKYQVFLKSKMEFKNFKRYALLYGLEFNRVGFKLSYVKTENDKRNDIYHLLAMLGIKIKKYHSDNENSYSPRLQYVSHHNVDNAELEHNDIVRYNLCPYRFALESVVQDGVLYRDRFLIVHYMRILLKNRVLKKLNHRNYSDDLLKNTLDEVYQELNSKFHITTELEKTQILASVYKSISKDKHNKPYFSDNASVNEEDFLLTNIKYIEKKIIIESSEEKIISAINSSNRYMLHFGKHCTYCASKDICLHRKTE